MSLTSDINASLESCMWGIAEHYAREYKKSGKNFVRCFIKYPSVRTNCIWIRSTCTRNGIMQEAKEMGKDFSEWAGKVGLDEYNTGLLSDMLVLIYYMNYEETETSTGVC